SSDRPSVNILDRDDRDHRDERDDRDRFRDTDPPVVHEDYGDGDHQHTGGGASRGSGARGRDWRGAPYGDSGANGGPRYSDGGRPYRPDSKKECRVYVGNLAYDVGEPELRDFMSKAGEVLHADVLLQPGGRSKGCAVVEYSTPEEAQRAVSELTEKQLNGRAIFVREDRENGTTYYDGPNGPPRSRGGFRGGRGRGGYGGYGGGGYGGGGGPHADGDITGRQVYIVNLPYIIAWQDLKDLFRQAGTVVRADIHMGPDGRSKGTGSVLYETQEDAKRAIGE
ncbi:hypothetical protein HDU93_000369, partial [Gonapodya sp. JEL0774]